MDFLSGDVTPQSALAESLMAARILAQQGKPWDLMSWSFNSRWGERGASTKVPVQLQQEAAVVMAAAETPVLSRSVSGAGTKWI